MWRKDGILCDKLWGIVGGRLQLHDPGKKQWCAEQESEADAEERASVNLSAVAALVTLTVTHKMKTYSIPKLLRIFQPSIT
jgi:hypothetical protein